MSASLVGSEMCIRDRPTVADKDLDAATSAADDCSPTADGNDDKHPESLDYKAEETRRQLRELQVMQDVDAAPDLEAIESLYLKAKEDRMRIEQIVKEMTANPERTIYAMHLTQLLAALDHENSCHNAAKEARNRIISIYNASTEFTGASPLTEPSPTDDNDGKDANDGNTDHLDQQSRFASAGPSSSSNLHKPCLLYTSPSPRD